MSQIYFHSGKFFSQDLSDGFFPVIVNDYHRQYYKKLKHDLLQL